MKPAGADPLSFGDVGAGPDTHGADGYGHEMLDVTDVPISPAPLPTQASTAASDNNTVDLKTSHSFGETIADASMSLVNANLKITVHSPQKDIGPTIIPGVDEVYMTYEVSTSTCLPMFRAQNFSVRRRFKDFVALSKLLPRLYPGSFIPGRPHRNAVEGRRMSPAFVDARCAGLERYLNRLAAHPLVGTSEVLRVFLEAEGDLRSKYQWHALFPPAPSVMDSAARFVKQLAGMERAAPSPLDVAQPASASRDVYRLMREQMAQLSGTLRDVSVTAEERQLRDDTAVLTDMRTGLHAAMNTSRAWSRASAEYSEALGGLATSLNELCKFESGSGFTSSQPAAVLAQAALQVQAAGAQAQAQQSGCLLVLQYYQDVMPNILGAMGQRERALLTLLTIQSDIQRKRAKLDGSCAGGNFNKQAVLKDDIAALELAAEAAEAEYQRAAERNAAEVVAFRRQQAVELLAMMRDLARSQVVHAEQTAQLWGHAAAALSSSRVQPVSQ